MSDFSSLAYNGVNLNVVKTLNYQRTPVFSDDGSDYLYTHVNLSVMAVFNPEAISYPVANPPVAEAGALPPDTMHALEYVLMQPRQDLVYSFGGTDLVVSPLAGNNSGTTLAQVDALNGPKPIEVSTSVIHGAKTWLVRYTIETWILECPDGSLGRSPIISNRWEQSHAIDDRYFTTITTSGEAVARTDQLNQRTADAFRDEILGAIPVPRYFRRVAINVTVNPIGNRLAYQVVDREQSYALGDTTSAGKLGVVDFQAHLTHQTVSLGPNMPPGPTTIEAISVTVRGIRTALRANLIVFAVKLAIAKLRLPSGPAAPSEPMLLSARVVESLHEPAVEFHVQALLRPDQGNQPQGMGPLLIQWLGVETPASTALLGNNGINPLPPNDKGTRGTFTAAAFVAALKDACAQSVKQIVGGGMGGGPNGGGVLGGGGSSDDPPSIVVGISLTPPTVSNNYSSTWHTDYAIDLRFVEEENNLQLPSTGAAGTPAVVIRLANPTMKMVADWTAERAGAKPICPSANIGDSNYKLLRRAVQPASPVILADGGTRGYRISGTYEYALLKPLPENGQLPMGVMPWTTLQFNDANASYSGSDFQQGIIGPSGGVVGGFPPLGGNPIA